MGNKLMRLLSFVPCGNRAGPIDDAPPAADQAAERRRRRRRNSGAALGEEAVSQWRPTLGDICELGEFNTDLAKARRGNKVAPARIGKSSSWAVSRILPRAHSDEYRYSLVFLTR